MRRFLELYKLSYKIPLPCFDGFRLTAYVCLGIVGGRSRTRTYDPLIKSQLLYHLSYAPAL